MKKKGNKKMPTPRKSFITPSLHLCFFEDLTHFYVGIWISVCIVHCVFSSYYKATVLSISKDVGMGLSWCRHLLVPFLFMT